MTKHPVQVEYDFTGMCGCTACVARRETIHNVVDVPDDTKHRDTNNHRLIISFVGTISRREFILLFGAED